MAEEVKVIITADDSELVDSFNNLADQAEALESDAENLSKALNKSFSDTKGIDSYTKEVEKAAGETKKLAKETEKSAKSSVKASQATTAFGRALSVLGGAGRKVGSVLRLLAANPLIAAFTVLVGVATTLVKAFTSTKEGAEALQRASAFLSAGLDVLRDIAVTVGKRLISAFEDPVQAAKDLGAAIVDNVLNRFKGIIELSKSVGGALKAAFDLDLEALKQSAADAGTALTQITTGLDAEQQKSFAKAVSDTANEISREGAEAARLTGILQKVTDKQRELSVQRAKLNANLAKARAIAQDANTPLLKRIELIESITKKENKQLNAEIAAQSRRVNALKAIAAQSDSNKQTLDEIAQAEIKLANLRTKSTQRLLAIERTRIQLQKESEKRTKEIADFENSLRDALVKNEQERLTREVEASKQARDKKINDLLAGDANEKKRQNALLISNKIYQDQLLEIEEEARKKREENTRRANDKALQDALAQERLRAEVATFELDKTLELDRQKFAETAKTEQQITAFEEGQNKKRLENQLKLQIARVKVLKDFSKDATDEEKKRLDAEQQLLEAQLKGINTSIEQAKPKQKEGTGLFGLLGISEDTQSEVQAVQGALKQVTGEISKAVAERIAILDKEIDFRNQRISEIQKDLENEIKLNELGKASNIKTLQEQLDGEKGARDRAEAEKKKAAEAQFTLDTALQASNLATAISGLYASLASLPFGIGVALATVLSGVLLGTFISSKAQAANAAGFYEGTENVGKALGASSATFSGKDGYLGEANGKVFRFDGDERILSPSQNMALGNMTNEELVQKALDHNNIPRSTNITLKNKNIQRTMYKNKRESKENKLLKEMANQNDLLKQQLKAIKNIPEVAQVGKNKVVVKRGSRTEIHNWKD